MKKTILLILIFVLLFSVADLSSPTFAYEPEPFVIRGGITWGMSKDDVIGVEKEEPIQSSLAFDYFYYYGTSVSKFEDCDLIYAFIDNALTGIVYRIHQQDEESIKDDETYIINSLTKKYGEPKANIDYVKEVLTKVDIYTRPNIDPDERDKQLTEILLNKAVWVLVDGTVIVCDNNATEETTMFNISYYSPYIGEFNTNGL